MRKVLRLRGDRGAGVGSGRGLLPRGDHEQDGDWIIRETPEACAIVLGELEARGARYRPAAPLDVHARMLEIAQHLLPHTVEPGLAYADAQ
jgi:hypothetical protein